jgi:hypothetical protein
VQRSVAERAAVVAALALVLVVNWLANALPLGGLQTGEVSALYESHFTPAGFTFAIWGVIYTGLVLYAIYQAFPARRDEARLLPIGRLFVINCTLNAAWLFAWHHQLIGLSMLLMLCMLATLVGIYRQLGAWGDTRALVRIPFSLYLAWICVATLANASALQTAWDGNELLLSHVNWTLLKIALAGAVGATVCVLRCDAVFVLVIAWAAYGIASKQAAVAEVHGAALAVSALCLLMAIFTLVRVVMRRGGAVA